MKLIKSLTAITTLCSCVSLSTTSCASKEEVEKKLELTVDGPTNVEAGSTITLTVSGKYDGKDAIISNVFTYPSLSEYIQVTVNEDKTITVKGTKITESPIPLTILAKDSENHDANCTTDITVLEATYAKSVVTSDPTPITLQKVNQGLRLANVATLTCKFYDKHDQELQGKVKWIVDVQTTATGVVDKPTVTVDSKNKVQIDASLADISADTTFTVTIKGEEKNHTPTDIGFISFDLEVIKVSKLTDIEEKNSQGEFTPISTVKNGLWTGDLVYYSKSDLKAKLDGKGDGVNPTEITLKPKNEGEARVVEHAGSDACVELLAKNQDVVLILSLSYDSETTNHIATGSVEITCKAVEAVYKIVPSIEDVTKKEGKYLSLTKYNEDISNQATFSFPYGYIPPTGISLDSEDPRWLMVDDNASIVASGTEVSILVSPKDANDFDPIVVTFKINVKPENNYSFKQYDNYFYQIQQGQCVPMSLYKNEWTKYPTGNNIITYEIVSQTGVNVSIAPGEFGNDVIPFVTVESWPEGSTKGTFTAKATINKKEVIGSEISIYPSSITYTTSPDNTEVLELTKGKTYILKMKKNNVELTGLTGLMWKNFVNVDGELNGLINAWNDAANSQLELDLKGEFETETTTPSKMWVFATMLDEESRNDQKFLRFQFNNVMGKLSLLETNT